MALPKIETPKYNLTLPVSGKKVKYRPFLVREQKILLQAIEMGDSGQVDNAVEDIIKACTYNELDIYELPFADVEFLVLTIRSSSVGSGLPLVYRCKNPVIDEEGNEAVCDTQINVNADLQMVKVDMPEDRQYVYQLTESIGLTLKEITYGDLKESMELENEVDRVYKLLTSSVKNVFDKDQIYSDFSREEIADWLENLQNEDFGKVEEFANTIPTVKMDLPVRCPNCKHEEQIVLRGLQDFLG